jgi:predicted transcriptional regulator
LDLFLKIAEYQERNVNKFISDYKELLELIKSNSGSYSGLQANENYSFDKNKRNLSNENTLLLVLKLNKINREMDDIRQEINEVKEALELNEEINLEETIKRFKELKRDDEILKRLGPLFIIYSNFM